MNKKFLIFIAVVILFLAFVFFYPKKKIDDTPVNTNTASSLVEIGQSAVLKSLKDPGSAKFGYSYQGKDRFTLCGTVNAKNGYGGYTGDTRFIYSLENGQLVFDDGNGGFSETWGSMCDKAKPKILVN
ncbi:hypothetical protein [Serratia plymuthica]|uniref:hypothetical protein n=1 Tax=Serratia plymuthica TaxID=82996 RepID=UPI0012FD3671|nr:hypothetical protein [Serratia plymuthica]